MHKQKYRFTTCFKTCGTGSLFWRVGPNKLTDRTDGGWVQSTFGAKAEQISTMFHIFTTITILQPLYESSGIKCPVSMIIYCHVLK